MLLYDGSSRRARASADRLRTRLPVGYPVLALEELPAAGTLTLDAETLAGTVAWVAVDGQVHVGRRGVGRALVACGGRGALGGWAMLVPGLGTAVLALWQLGPAPVPAT